jgi:hypothetical protein
MFNGTVIEGKQGFGQAQLKITSKKVRSQNAHDYVGLEIANACCFMNLAHQKHFLNDWPPIFSPTSSIIRTGASREIRIIQFFHSPLLL